MERKLDDRIETFDSEIEGKCKCGQPVNKVINSSVSGWKNRERYYYPGQTSAWNIFRCCNCSSVIQSSFVAGRGVLKIIQTK